MKKDVIIEYNRGEKTEIDANDASPIKYLIHKLNDKTDFLREYKSLTKQEQNELKQWAQEEQEYNKGRINETDKK